MFCAVTSNCTEFLNLSILLNSFLKRGCSNYFFEFSSDRKQCCAHAHWRVCAVGKLLGPLSAFPSTDSISVSEPQRAWCPAACSDPPSASLPPLLGA